MCFGIWICLTKKAFFYTSFLLKKKDSFKSLVAEVGNTIIGGPKMQNNSGAINIFFSLFCCLFSLVVALKGDSEKIIVTFRYRL